MSLTAQVFWVGFVAGMTFLGCGVLLSIWIDKRRGKMQKHEIQDGVCFYHGLQCPVLGLMTSVGDLLTVLEQTPNIQERDFDYWRQRVTRAVSLIKFNLSRLR